MEETNSCLLHGLTSFIEVGPFLISTEGVYGMNDLTQLDLLSLSSTFSKTFKKRFGKGPGSCQALFNKGRLYISIRNFMTPAEEVLIANNEYNLAIKFRAVVIKTVIKEFIENTSPLLNGEFKNAYHDWNYQSNTGFVLLEHSDLDEEEPLSLTGDQLLEAIEGIGLHLHKRPEKLRKVLSTQSLCVIEVTGVQTPMETLLYKNGSTTLLQRHLEEIKSGYLEHKGRLESIFCNFIEDIFLMGDYKRNKYIIVFAFRRNSQ